MINQDTVLAWPFAPQHKRYGYQDVIATARGLGAGLPGPLREADAPYLGEQALVALPMMAVGLADGAFWQQDPATGIDWRKIVHAAEAITQHRPLPVAGEVVVSQRIVSLADRGVARGAVMVQEQVIADGAGRPYVTIDVTTVLRGDGGFGGPPDTAPRVKTVPQDRAPDAAVVILTPAAAVAAVPGLVMTAALDVAADSAAPMLRGMGIFGLAGRAALALVCGNDAARLRHFSVRYAGPMFCDEQVRVEVWWLAPGRAALRMTAVERDAPILNHCLVEFDD
ncbi:MAG: hypothetical protein WC247_13790 [Porticoccaceae bacterium]